MNSRRSLLVRVGAYLIDLCIVVILSSLISSIPVLNKESEKYQEIYKEYQEKYTEYENALETLEEMYEDKDEATEEYNELENSLYKDMITKKYEDENITKEEYKELVKEINSNFDNIAKDYVYLLNKNNKVNTIVTLIITIVYFGLLQYLAKGQTVGKRLLKIRVVSATDKKLNVLTYTLRSLIVNDVLLNTIGVLFLFLASKKVYISSNNIIGTLVSICEALIIFTVITREDARGIHDLLFGTKVVSTAKENEKQVKLIEVESPKEPESTQKNNNQKVNQAQTKKNSSKKTQKDNVVDAEYKEKKKKRSTK